MREDKKERWIKRKGEDRKGERRAEGRERKWETKKRKQDEEKERAKGGREKVVFHLHVLVRSRELSNTRCCKPLLKLSIKTQAPQIHQIK